MHLPLGIIKACKHIPAMTAMSFQSAIGVELEAISYSQGPTIFHDKKDSKYL